MCTGLWSCRLSDRFPNTGHATSIVRVRTGHCCAFRIAILLSVWRTTGSGIHDRAIRVVDKSIWLRNLSISIAAFEWLPANNTILFDDAILFMASAGGATLVRLAINFGFFDSSLHVGLARRLRSRCHLLGSTSLSRILTNHSVMRMFRYSVTLPDGSGRSCGSRGLSLRGCHSGVVWCARAFLLPVLRCCTAPVCRIAIIGCR